jgi:hypothetical protein
MLSSVFKLTDLQQRREPKKEVDIIIQIKSNAEEAAEEERRKKVKKKEKEKPINL